MTLEDIRSLFAYTYWANHRLLDVVSGLSADEFTKDLASSHGGIHGTLVHAMGAEEIWLRRWKGTSPARFYSASDFPTFEMLTDHWEVVEMEVLGFCHMLKEEAELLALLTYTDLRGHTHTQPLVQTMQHMANHSTYHRGQVVTMLRQLGKKAVGTDLVAYYREEAAK